MGQLLAPWAFGSKKCVVLAFVVRPDTHSCFSFWSAEASRNLGFLRGIPHFFIRLPQNHVTKLARSLAQNARNYTTASIDYPLGPALVLWRIETVRLVLDKSP